MKEKITCVIKRCGLQEEDILKVIKENISEMLYNASMLFKATYRTFKYFLKLILINQKLVLVQSAIYDARCALEYY